jgi:hypothetical protein
MGELLITCEFELLFDKLTMLWELLFPPAIEKAKRHDGNDRLDGGANTDNGNGGPDFDTCVNVENIIGGCES